MRFSRLLPLLALLLPGTALAQINPCPLGNAIPCGTGGAVGFSFFVSSQIIPQMKLGFAGVMLIFFVYYALRLILESGEESTVAEIKSAYGQAVTGAIFVSLAALVVEAVGNQASTTLINSQSGGPVWEIFTLLIRWGTTLMGTLVMVFVAYQGMRMIILHGEESETEKQKQRFFYGLAGVAIVLLASPIVTAVTGRSPGILGEQGKAAANLMLEVIGFMVVLSLIVAGIYMIFSTTDTRKEQAKNIFLNCSMALIVVFSCFVIVTYVLSI